MTLEPSKQRTRATRHERKRQRLGVPNPACAVCGYDRIPSLVEAHHVAGEANQADLVVALCRNHHGELSDEAEDSLGELRRRDPQRDPLTKLAALMLGLVAFLKLLAEQLEQWAAWLLIAAAALAEALGASWWETLPLAVPG